MVVSSDPDPIFFPHKSEIFINADPDLGSGDSIDAVPTGSRHLTLEDKVLENIFCTKNNPLGEKFAYARLQISPGLIV